MLLFSDSHFFASASFERKPPQPHRRKKKPTVNEAQAFVDDAEKQLFDLEIKAQRAAWVEENFITVDTEQMAADANQEVTAKGVLLSRGAHRFESISLPPELARKILLLEISTLLPSPADPALQKELAAIETSLEGDYGKGAWCPDGEYFAPLKTWLDEKNRKSNNSVGW
jgi:peptidyl-dipeptidase A